MLDVSGRWADTHLRSTTPCFTQAHKPKTYQLQQRIAEPQRQSAGPALASQHPPGASDFSSHLPQESSFEGTWTPKVCKMMAFLAIFGGFGLLFSIPLGSRYLVSSRASAPWVSPPKTGAVRARQLVEPPPGRGALKCFGIAEP